MHTNKSDITKNLLAAILTVISLTSYAQYWNTDGNAGTNQVTDFIGTTDNKSFAIRTDNNEVARFGTNGCLGIGVTAPPVKLSIKAGWTTSPNGAGGAIYVTNPNNQPLVMAYNNANGTTNTAQEGTIGVYSTSLSGLFVINPNKAHPPFAALGDGKILLGGNGTGNSQVEVRKNGTNYNNMLLVGDDNNNEYFSVSGAGNTGIGTAAPTSKLHVMNGDIEITTNQSLSSPLLKWTSGFTTPAAMYGSIWGTMDLTGNTWFNISAVDNTPDIRINQLGQVHIAPVTSHAEPLLISDRWLFHNGGYKCINYNARWNAATQKNIRVVNGYYSAMVQTDRGDIEFRTGPEGTAGTDVGANVKLLINNNGKVVISQSNTANLSTPGNYSLYVQDGIMTEKVKVALKNGDWSDFVFHENYRLNTLAQVEEYICQAGHLPDVPSAKEVEQNGVDLGQMDAILLRKIEELTLYVITLEKMMQSIIYE